MDAKGTVNRPGLERYTFLDSNCGTEALMETGHGGPYPAPPPTPGRSPLRGSPRGPAETAAHAQTNFRRPKTSEIHFIVMTSITTVTAPHLSPKNWLNPLLMLIFSHVFERRISAQRTSGFAHRKFELARA